MCVPFFFLTCADEVEAVGGQLVLLATQELQLQVVGHDSAQSHRQQHPQQHVAQEDHKELESWRGGVWRMGWGEGEREGLVEQ